MAEEWTELGWPAPFWGGRAWSVLYDFINMAPVLFNHDRPLACCLYKFVVCIVCLQRIRKVEAGAFSVHLNIRILPFTYGPLCLYIIRSTCAVPRWPFPGVFTMCFMGFDGLFFRSLKPWLWHCYYTVFADPQSYIYFFRVPTWKSNFSRLGG